METQAKAIVLLGAPGSGKGTQAKLLRDCLRIPHVSTGEILRERIRSGAENGSGVAATMHSGDLVADDLVNRLVEERLSQPDAAAGFILDGYPRTTAQAAASRLQPVAMSAALRSTLLMGWVR